MNAVLYARVSTDKQAHKDLSIPAQLRLMHEYARAQGWTVIEELIEPGASATNADRPVLQDMLTRIVRGALKADVVLAHKLNRLARNLDDYVPIRAALWKAGVRLAYVVEKVDDTAAGRLLENVMASIAQFESANLSEETKKGMRQKVLQGGWPHRPPRGYVAVRGSGEHRGSRCEVHPREGALIRRAFELFAHGQLSIDSIARTLATEGLTTGRGLPLATSHMHRILTNPFYVGRIEWRGLNVKGAHTPLIEETLFERVQEVMRRRRAHPLTRRTTNGFPLKGVAICGTCRGRMTAESHGRHGYYRCSRQANNRRSCDARYCPAFRAHRDVVSVLKRLQIARELAERIRAEARRLLDTWSTMSGRAAEGDQSGAVSAESQLTRLFLSGHVSAAEYSQRAFDLRAALIDPHSAEYDPARVRARIDSLLEMSTSVYDIYEKCTDDWQRSQLIGAVFDTLVLGGDGILGFVAKAPFSQMATTSQGEQGAARAVIDAAA